MKILDAVKTFFGLAFCVILRLISMPLPNFEPIMGTMLPFAQKLGRYAGFAFGFMALVSIDFITGRLGMWTVYCGIAYGGLGYAASIYLSRFKGFKLKNYLLFGVAGTMAYDFVTALLFGFQFGQTLEVTLFGQIPFTVYHLAGNLLFVTLLSPAVYYGIVENKSLEALSTSEYLKRLRFLFR
ncbi:hypothetical protein HY991_03365 [Candidatus Micrarchaeota archaeon]|nr:hypothetical protein [Candidatus Micrarchaeota archaeon]